MHAGAQFILAETASGEYLISLFPSLHGKVLPLLRSSSIKYKKSALGKIYTSAKLDETEKERFEKQFEKKSRATIEVEVTLKDEQDEVVAIGVFSWFVQKNTIFV
jgi:acyl-coenzyme A thioesterase PaaI-like protein